jgi:hypothetical protein
MTRAEWIWFYINLAVKPQQPSGDGLHQRPFLIAFGTR